MGWRNGKLTPQSGVHYVAEGLPFNWTKVNTEGRKTFSAFAELEAAKEKVAILAVRADPAFGNLWHQLNAEVVDRCRRRNPLCMQTLFQRLLSAKSCTFIA
uniref:Uncharacterized 11.3 kDa protein in psiA-psiB intergenic region n=1 Tax=Rhizobium leguminosarum bv. phaseoli TaxID=385 RepID=YPSI_RHILP|nr:RecName: Full=Uncharacterized 11.3 kDa protein in psiA-psiB intergenic region; AltName: Full=ORF-P [Rhizobium leguminosarum bv. phaseoli]